MDKTALLKKVRALAEHGVGGEAENAEKLLARMMKKYGISEEELDEETRVRHDFTYHGGEEKKILRQVVYKVTGGYAYELVYTASGRKVRTQLGADCTPAEKVEIEYLFDFYKRLWEKEKDAFLAAYIQKHRIFAIRADVEPQEISREEALNVNCHGCKWLDRYKKDGNGYCCMVERSKTQREKVRRPDMERCELYKPGDFNTRYRTEVNE